MQINGFTMPQGATHFCPAFGVYPNRAFQLNAEGWAKWTGFEWRDLARSPTDSAMSNMMTLPTEGPWNGEGVPPAGIPVEIKLKGTRGDWCHATVLFCQDDALVIAWKAEGVARPTILSAVDIRPTRTAEQIAAEEREEAIRKMEQTSGSHVGSAITRVICELLYDAGARMPGEGGKA